MVGLPCLRIGGFTWLQFFWAKLVLGLVGLPGSSLTRNGFAAAGAAFGKELPKAVCAVGLFLPLIEKTIKNVVFD